jgi:hypothetical protein
MKRNFILILAIFITLQGLAQSKINYRGGLNFLSSSVNLAGDKFAPSLGFFVGGIYNLPVKNTKFHIRPEISFSKERFNYIAPGGKDLNINYTFNYLKLPIMAGYQLNNKLELEAGIQNSLLINSTYEQLGKKGKNYAAASSFGLGLGIRYPLENKGLILHLRYLKGLTCVCYTGEGDPEKISGIQLGIIYTK